MIKVEPIEGDVARASQPQADGMGALYINNNRNKRKQAGHEQVYFWYVAAIRAVAFATALLMREPRRASMME